MGPENGVKVVRRRKPAPTSLENVQKNKLAHIHRLMENVEMASLAAEASVGASKMAGLEDQAEESMPEAEAKNQADLVGGKMLSRQVYGKHLKKAISDADVVIEVLDARDPLGYRSKVAERQVLQAGKKLVFLLNKCDLVPDLASVEEWRKYLSTTAPVCVFRSMTQKSRSKQSTAKFESGKNPARVPAKIWESGYACVGAVELMDLLNNYTRIDKEMKEAAALLSLADNGRDKGEDKAEDRMAEDELGERPVLPPKRKTITVAVIGVPNVGKSSVINSLLRNSSRVPTGNEAGVTRAAQTLVLTKHIKLIDTPGVILDGDEDDPRNVLRGAVKKYDMALGEQAVLLLLKKRETRESVCAHFNISLPCGDVDSDAITSADVRKFLSRVCESRKLLAKGSKLDLNTALKVVISSWNDGLVKSCVAAPVVRPTVVSLAAVVTGGPSPEFDLSHLL